jgi:hypothetical protein
MSVCSLSKWSRRNRFFSPFTLTLITMFSILFCACQILHAAQVTLAWDANSDPVAGYRLYYGHSSRNYQTNVNVGNATTYTWSGLADGQTYYFAATAYDASNNQSDYSEELVCHTITPSSGTGGSVSPAGTVFVKSGGGQTFTISPSAGFRVSDVRVNGQSIGAVTSHSFTGVTGPQTIAASFVPEPTNYTITASVTGGGGSISPSAAVSVSAGGSQTFSIVPIEGYRVGDVLVNGGSVGAVSSYEFLNVAGNGTITASFVPITYTITSSVSGSGGSIAPSGAVQVNSGSSRTFTITPLDNYQIDKLIVDGQVQTSPSNPYTFVSVTSNHTISVSFKSTNALPVADAGPDQKVSEGAVVTLQGSNSTDADNGIVSYRWQQTGGPTVQLSSTSAADPTFTAPDVGPGGAALTFRLTVTDGLQATASDTCIVNVTRVNAPPVANAGPDQTVSEWTNVTLNGSQSADGDDGIASYSWRQTKGPSVQLTGADQPTASFVALDIDASDESLTFELTVTDHNGLKATDTCIVNVSWVNAPPVADAGPDQTVYEGDATVLDAMASSDDEGIVSYRWRQTAGIPVNLSDPASPTAQFIAPTIVGARLRAAAIETLTFTVTVTDANGLESEDVCQVNVSRRDGLDLDGTWLSSSCDGLRFRGVLQLKNGGTLKAGSFEVSFYLSHDGVSKDRLLKTLTIRSMKAGSMKNLALSLRDATLAGQFVIAVVDSTQAIEELDESNNDSALLVQQTAFRRVKNK